MRRNIIRPDVTPWRLALDVLAVARLTHLITTDVITEPARRWVRRRGQEALVDAGSDPNNPQAEQLTEAGELVADLYGEDVAHTGGPLAYLVTCPWCVSPYVAALWLAARRTAPETSRRLGLVLAVSYAVSRAETTGQG